MSDRYKGAILSPTAPTVTPQSAGGIYTSSQQLQYQGQGVWPQAVNYPINNSLRFRKSASAYLNRTPTSAGNQKTFTFSTWLKRGGISSDHSFFTSGNAAPNPRASFEFTTSDTLYISFNNGSGWVALTTSAVYRDPSAWYHIVVAVDTTQATSTNRVKLYVNGSQVTAFSSATYPNQNDNTSFNDTVPHSIGSYIPSPSQYLDGYLGEVNFIDGVQLTPSSFGTTDAYGIWQPIPYTGAYGTNGFYLPFYNSTTLGTSVTANYLIVAGGGSGQGSGFQYVYGGGGGAGGLLTGTTTLNSAANYTITVGAGGSGVSGTDSPGNNGSNSTAFGLTAIGGSGGRSALGGGGSGGGAGSYGGGNTSGTSGQGNSGGTATAYGATASGGGGGGAGAAGGNGSSGAGGAGGAGTASSISGSSVTYAGGGGGAGSSSGGAGGAGGGGAGAGAAGNGTNGTANTGGGGGAAATTSGGNQTSGAGGSGIVIVSYAGSQRYVGGTVTTSGGNTIHTFTSSGTLTVLGNDFSGNGNNWTLNNISLTPGSTYDSMKDVPTNTNSNTANYATFNGIGTYTNSTSNVTYSNGNLQVAYNSADVQLGSSIRIPNLSGKFYLEFTATYSSSSNGFVGLFIPNGSVILQQNGVIGNFGVCTIVSTTGVGYSSGQIISFAIDADTKIATIRINNTVNTVIDFAAVPTNVFIDPAVWLRQSGDSFIANYGQRPFAYTPPTGFLPLNTYNLPTPTILDGDQYFNATTYTGTGATLAVTNSGSMQPDFVWIKTRNQAGYGHELFDSVRGATKFLISNSTGAESTEATSLTAFNSNGFTVGSWGFINGSGDSEIAWQWRANAGTNVSNTQGTITSTVSANTTAGFSVVTYTGTGSAATIGHGLGVAPSMMIVKRRNGAANWFVYHSALGATQYIYLDATAAAITASGAWNNTAPTSTVFSVGNFGEVNLNTGTYVAYCFAPVAGYSAFGSYTGNGSTDGPFIFTGFRPRFVMLKVSSGTTANWVIVDTSRNTFNVANSQLNPDSSDAEFSGSNIIDIVSNGFKLRNTPSTFNGNGNTYIYACFAENPFKIARGR